MAVRIIAAMALAWGSMELLRLAGCPPEAGMILAVPVGLACGYFVHWAMP